MKRRRLLKKTAVGVCVLALLLIIFHRPLLRWAVDFGGRKAASAAGLTITWKVSGSVTGGLALDDVKITGGSASPVVSGTVSHADASYDLWALKDGADGAGRTLKSLTVRELDLALDLTKPKPASPPKPAKSGGPPSIPEITLPRIQIDRATVRMKLANGTMAVEEFSLLLDPAAPGVISVKRFAAPGFPDLLDARGKTSATAHSLALESLSLWPGVVLETLGVDLAGLPAGSLPVKLAATQDAASVEADAVVGLFGEGLPVKGTVEIADFPHSVLRRWHVPLGPVDWTARSLHLDVDGPVLRPDLLGAKLNLAAESIAGPGFEVDSADVSAELRGGLFTLEKLTARRGPNTVTAEGTARPPDKWADVVKSEGAAALTMDAPQLARSLPETVKVNAAVAGKGTLTFAKGRMVTAEVQHTAQNIVTPFVTARSAKVTAKLRDGTVRLEALEVELDDANRLTTSGRFSLEGDMPWSAEWKASSEDLAGAGRALNQGDAFKPAAGRVVGSGSARGSVALLKAGRWKEITAATSLRAEGVKLKTAALRDLRLEASLTGGVATLREAAVSFDEKNNVSATGSARLLEKGMPFSAEAAVRLPSVEKLNDWSKEFGGPAVLGGSVTADLRAEGVAEKKEVTGAGDVNVASLRLGGVPEVLGLKASVRMSGQDVEVPTLEATAGPWKVSGAVRRAEGRIELTNLDARVRNEKLVTGSLSAPLGGGTGPGGLRVDEPLAVDLRVDGLDTDRLATALGQKFPAGGVVTATVKADGPFRALNMNADISLKRVRAATGEARKLEPASADLHAVLKEGGLKLTGQVTQTPLRPLTLSAEMPLDPAALIASPDSLKQTKIQARAVLPPSDLAFLTKLVPALREVRGTASVDLTISGTVADPDPRGRVRVTASEIVTVGGGSQSIRDLNVDLRADERRLNVDACRVMLAGGVLELRGHADIQKPADPVLDLRVIAEEILVLRDDTVSARADADVTILGPLTGAAVRGQVAVVRGRVFKEIEYLPLSLPNQLPPPPPAVRVGKSGPPSLPAPLDKWNFDVKIITRDPVRLTGNIARGGAVADLRLRGTGAKPVLTGEVRMEETWVKLPFSRLNVRSGVVRFAEETPFDPTIALVGDSMVGGREVTVNVDGRALDPKIRLSSNPPLPEGEIATLLATGVTTGDLTSGGGDQVAGRAAFLLISQTYRKIFRKTAAKLDDDEEPPRLSFEFSLFGGDATRRGVSAVYEFNPKWRAIGRVGESGTFRGLLYYLIRFR